MWVELSNAEIDLIIDALGEGPLADRLRERPHRHTGAFTRAAEEKAAGNDEKLIIEASGIIERHDFGAYVMTWIWVSDEQAGVPTSFDGFTVSDEIRNLFENLRSFRIFDLDFSTTAIIANGKMDDYEWKFQTAGQVWVLTAFTESGINADWLHIEEWKLGTPSRSMSGSDVLSSIGRALQILATSSSNSRLEHHPLQWRKYLELYALGAVSAEEAVKWLNVTVEALEKKAQPIRERIDENRRNGVRVSFAGPGIPRFDIECTSGLV